MDNTDNSNNINPSIYRPTSPTIPTYNNYPPVNTPYNRVMGSEDTATLDFREKMARKLGFASLIYAVFSTFCLYHNFSGITMPFFGIATLIYMIYGLSQYDVKPKKTSWFYAAIIMGLSISSFLTGNLGILFFNAVGIFFLLFIFLLHNVYDDKRWNFSKTVLAICEAFFSSFGCLDDFGKDMKTMKQRNATSEVHDSTKATMKYVMIGLLISIPVVAIILALLSGADAVFNSIFGNYILKGFTDMFDNFGDVVGVLITFLVFFFGAYCVMRTFSKKAINEEVYTNRSMEPIIAITVLSIISVIYLIFSVIQIVFLFIGKGQLPENYTYAQYAREGFFQLLAVAVINFLMVLFVNNHFRENLALKILMTIISVCTYIMIASSCMRMLLYINVYLLTTLRILVLWGLAVLALLFAAVIISIYKHDFPLFKYSIVVVCIMYLALSFARTDYIIADYNLSHYSSLADEDNKNDAFIDYDYLRTLSTDAAPVIYQYDGAWVDGYFKNCKIFYNRRSWRRFNISAYTAEVLDKSR